jgi:DNA-binding MarR family transcriptional regulator
MELPFPHQTELSPEDIRALVESGLVKPVRRTKDGRVTEYELTWLARRMLGQCDPAERKG